MQGAKSPSWRAARNAISSTRNLYAIEKKGLADLGHYDFCDVASQRGRCPRSRLPSLRVGAAAVLHITLNEAISGVIALVVLFKRFHHISANSHQNGCGVSLQKSRAIRAFCAIWLWSTC